MHIPLTKPADIGHLIRATRKTQKLRQDDAAGAIGVSDVFLGGLENGAPGARLDKILQVLNGLGIVLTAEVSDEVLLKYQALQQTEKPAAKRKKSAMRTTSGRN